MTIIPIAKEPAFGGQGTTEAIFCFIFERRSLRFARDDKLCFSI